MGRMEKVIARMQDAFGWEPPAEAQAPKKRAGQKRKKSDMSVDEEIKKPAKAAKRASKRSKEKEEAAGEPLTVANKKLAEMADRDELTKESMAWMKSVLKE